jgi:exopolyphosphatase/guanosine-5'-triphosphate,3'-diphosphate pyrophosphatase
MPRVLAAADIGSNTVHLLVASFDGNRLSRIRNESDWLSLGEVVSREGLVPDAHRQRLITTLASFKASAQAAKAERFYVFATEAMRQAANHDEVLVEIQSRLGLAVDIIPARREAELSRLGVMIDSKGQTPMLLIEVGGGSAQVARCEGDGITEEASLPLGTGRLIARASLEYPCRPHQLRLLEAEIDEHVERCRDFGEVLRIVSCGGVARGLWRALHPDGDRTVHAEELDYLAWSAARLPVETISVRFGVKLKRAATLAPGALVYRRLLDAFGHQTMTVSEYGVREGAILEMISKGERCPA